MSIVFESQVDFERAVMKVLHERMSVHVTVSKGFLDMYADTENTKVQITLTDEYGGEIDSDSDYA